MQEPEAGRGVPWLHIGTVVGAVAAIGSLIFTGVATYYGAVVAQQQLEQSQEDSESKERNHATRVTYWEGTSFWADSKSRSVHLVNRSPDPVSHVQLYIQARWFDKELLLGFRELNLPPCKEMVYKATSLTAVLRNGENEVPLAGLKEWSAAFLTFADSAGEDWVRGVRFLEKGGYERILKALDGAAITGVVMSSAAPQVNDVEPCDAAS
ncbi:hypothetical protein SAM40697_0297 [Streptomyces ambofaciens]|uniref:Secreted protein n=1 Tax=Streptomyces ambofaciens TaxID=1889 RepID=A0ABN4NZ70_STRAM|nr:hypothetical protein [Streptomyces ambofaciens]ANB04260.1 hypothetical protein SAM40697_0297 [Streptomyces ambofaciens]